MALKLHDKWYTITEVEDGEELPTTFRVRAADTHKPVDAIAYLDQLVTGLCGTADSGQVAKAAQAAYQAVEVEIWTGLDTTPPDDGADAEDGSNEEIVVDLWTPLHLALMLQQAQVLEQLLHFHEEYAFAALDALARQTELPAPDEVVAVAGAPTTASSRGPNSLVQSVDELRLPRVRSVPEDSISSLSSTSRRVNPAAGNNNSTNTNASTAATAERSGSPLPTLCSEDVTAASRAVLPSPPEASQDPQPVPLFECQVRRELGNAVLLLGHYEAPVSTAAAAAAATARRSQGRIASAAHVEELTGTPRSQPLFGPLPPPPTADDEAAAVRRNRHINDLEQRVLADAGEEYCIANVMNALKPVLERVVQCLRGNLGAAQARKEQATEGTSTPPAGATSPVAHFALEAVRHHCSSFVDLLHRPALLVEGSVLYTACDGDLKLLTDVLGIFQGSLTPIFLGKKLCNLHHSSTAVGGCSSMAASPALYPIAASGSHSSSNAPTPRNQSLSRHGTAATRHVDPGATLSPHVGGAVNPTPTHAEPFWLACPPQEAQRLAFFAMWISTCEQLAERPGSARQRKASNALVEYRTTVSSFKRMRESNFVPSSVIWSGHVYLITKLLSHDCTIEDFLDVLGEGGYLPALSTSSIPGAFVALLAAGASAAVSVADVATLRLLTKKMETLLAEVPNRTSTLRTFLSARPVTHAERFEELWLGATSFTGPKKFKTRVEMLYYGAVEVVLIAAERAWQAKAADFASTPSTSSYTLAAAAAALADTRKRDEAQAAVQHFVALWRNFFASTRDKPFHRRSMSRGNSNFSFSTTTSEVKLTPRSKPVSDLHSDGPGVPAPLVTLPAPTTASALSGSTTPNATPTPQPPTLSKEVVVESESLAEFTEAVRKVCTNLPMRLQHGNNPLPAIYTAVYPGGANGGNGGGGGGGADGTFGDGVGGSTTGGGGTSASGGGGATPTHPDKALPVSSLDNEFAYVQRCFGEDAAKESNEIKLKFYGLYKQATVGDINIAKPWLMDTVGRAKWDAWNRLKGMSLVDAKRMYVNEYKLMKEMRAESEKGKK